MMMMIIKNKNKYTYLLYIVLCACECENGGGSLGAHGADKSERERHAFCARGDHCLRARVPNAAFCREKRFSVLASIGASAATSIASAMIALWWELCRESAGFERRLQRGRTRQRGRVEEHDRRRIFTRCGTPRHGSGIVPERVVCLVLLRHCHFAICFICSKQVQITAS
jgi:hypothetical protein